MVSYNQILDIAREEITQFPVTLTEVKNFCKIDISEGDTFIEDDLIPACVDEVESYLGINLVKREVVVSLNNCNGGVYFPYGPVAELDELLDEDGDEILAADYKTVGTNWMQLKEPKYRQMQATYQGGYETLPLVIKRGLLENIFYNYDLRKGVEGTPKWKETLKKYRRV
jgi:hypothetical protein